MTANQILERTFGIARGATRQAERLTRRVSSDAFGLFQRATHLRSAGKPEMDDVTIARKVESTIFRDPDAPKASVDVNAVDGIVWLRGEVKRPEQIRSLERQAAAVPEVRGVENLLHLPNTPSPTRADSPKRQQRTRSTTRRPTPRRTGGKVSDDHAGDIAPTTEPSPRDHAAEREGRTPAPFGGETGGGET